MEFAYAFKRASQVDALADRTNLSFSPDLKREPTFFSGELEKSVALPRGHQRAPRGGHLRSALQAQRQEHLQGLGGAAGAGGLRAGSRAARQRPEPGEGAERRAAEPLTQSRQRMSTFYRARDAYFKHLYERDREAWIVLDPVITVHPTRSSSSASARTSRATAASAPATRSSRTSVNSPAGPPQHRLLACALQRIPEDPQLQDHPLRGRPQRFPGADRARGRLRGEEDRSPRLLGARLLSR